MFFDCGLIPPAGLAAAYEPALAGNFLRRQYYSGFSYKIDGELLLVAHRSDNLKYVLRSMQKLAIPVICDQRYLDPSKHFLEQV